MALVGEFESIVIYSIFGPTLWLPISHAQWTFPRFSHDMATRPMLHNPGEIGQESSSGLRSCNCAASNTDRGSNGSRTTGSHVLSSELLAEVCWMQRACMRLWRRHRT